MKLVESKGLRKYPEGNQTCPNKVIVTQYRSLTTRAWSMDTGDRPSVQVYHTSGLFSNPHSGALPTKTARRLDVSITVKAIRHEQKQCWNMLRRKWYCKLPETCLYFFLWRQKCYQIFFLQYPSIVLDFVDVGNIFGCPYTRTYVLILDTKCTYVIRTNKMHTYEGWNFNSGNYLFTTDTK